MKKIKSYFPTLVLMLLGMAACKLEKEPGKVNGVVVDSTINSIVLATASGDTLFIAKMDMDPANLPPEGILLYDTVAVEYTVENSDSIPILKADKIVTIEHSPYFYIYGSWVAPHPIDPGQVEGIELKQDGRAASINMHTLVFESWGLDPENRRLILCGKSIGNGQTIEITDTLQVDKLDADSLILSKGDYVVWRFSSQK